MNIPCSSNSLLFALALAICGCSVSESSFEPGPAKNIILISLDTVRPDHLGTYGYPKDTSPTIDRLAEKGAVFNDAVAVSPWTRPSNATLLTGVYPLQHGARTFRSTLSADVPSLPELLAPAGFRCAAIVSSMLINERSGLDRGFEFFRYVSEWKRLPGGGKRSQDPGTRVTRDAIEWLDANAESRFFLFLHYYDAHSDYWAADEFQRLFASDYEGEVNGSTAQLMAVLRGERQLGEGELEHLKALYDAEIRQLDDEIRKLIEYLESEGLDRSTAILVTSDHGEEFMEHGGVLHARTYFREVIGVPLVMAGPGVPQGWRSDVVASHVDIAPTLLALAGLPVPPSMAGLDLARFWSSSPPPPTSRHLFAEADHSNDVPDQYRMVRSGSHKLIVDRRTGVYQFYDLAVDPAERHDVGEKHPERVREQLAALRAFEAEQRVPGGSLDLSSDDLEALSVLGYVE